MEATATSKRSSELSLSTKNIKSVHTTEELDALVKATRVVVVDFMASWCGPCKIFGPKYKALSEESHLSTVAFCTCDVDEGEEVAVREGIMVMPTIIIYKSGVKYAEIKGANLNQLTEKLNELQLTRGASEASLSPKTSGHQLVSKATRHSAPLEKKEMRKRKVKTITTVAELEAVARRHGVVVVAMTAPWAGTQLGPEYKALAASPEWAGVRFCLCDGGAAEGVARHVGVAEMPAMLIYKNGVKVSEIQGTKMELFIEQLSAVLAAAKVEGIVSSPKTKKSTATSQQVNTSLGSPKMVSNDFQGKQLRKEVLNMALPPPMEMLPIAMDPDVLAATKPIEPQEDGEIPKKGKAGIKLSGKIVHIQKASGGSKVSLSKSKPVKAHYNIPKTSKTN